MEAVLFTSALIIFKVQLFKDVWFKVQQQLNLKINTNHSFF